MWTTSGLPCTALEAPRFVEKGERMERGWNNHLTLSSFSLCNLGVVWGGGGHEWVKNTIFAEKTLQIARFVVSKNAMSQILWRKLSRIAIKS